MAKQASMSFDELRSETVTVLRKALRDSQYKAPTIKSIEAVSTPKELYNEINLVILAFGIAGAYRVDLKNIKELIDSLTRSDSGNAR